MRIGRTDEIIIKTTTEVLQQISLSTPLCLPDVPCGLAWNRTWSFAVTGQRLTAWATLHNAGTAVCHVAAWSCRKHRSHYLAKFLQYAIKMLNSISSLTSHNIFNTPSKSHKQYYWYAYRISRIIRPQHKKTNVLQECSLKFCTVNTNACVLTKNIENNIKLSNVNGTRLGLEADM